MGSARAYAMLEDMTTKEIQVLISMSIQYLEMNRQVDFKDILKDIKGCRKFLKRK